MSRLLWDLLLFGWGFIAGLAVAVGVAYVARMRREAVRDGERLLTRLGPLESNRFLQAVTES
jgi:hypothetical protein